MLTVTPLQAPVVGLYKTNYKLYMEHYAQYRSYVEGSRKIANDRAVATTTAAKEAKAAKAKATEEANIKKTPAKLTKEQLEGRKAHKKHLRREKRARRRERKLKAERDTLRLQGEIGELKRKAAITHFGTLEVVKNTTIAKTVEKNAISTAVAKVKTANVKAIKAAKSAATTLPEEKKGPKPRKPKTFDEIMNVKEDLPLNHPRRSGKALDQEILCHRPQTFAEFCTGAPNPGLSYASGGRPDQPPVNLVSNLPSTHDQNAIRLFHCRTNISQGCRGATTTELVNWLHYYETDPHLTLHEKEVVKMIRTVVNTRRANYGKVSPQEKANAAVARARDSQIDPIID